MYILKQPDGDAKQSLSSPQSTWSNKELPNSSTFATVNCHTNFFLYIGL